MSDILPIMAAFEPFPKIARLNRDIVITEKIDGTNAQIFVSEDKSVVLAGSRNRWLTPAADNFGFAKWVETHAEELKNLEPGRHYGEWWGHGIQRGYGRNQGDKRFSLFNVGRWNDNPAACGEKQCVPPACCYVVPVLYRGPFNALAIETCLNTLRQFGSAAAPSFPRPEGIVIFHEHAKVLFKVTLENDEKGKGE